MLGGTYAWTNFGDAAHKTNMARGGEFADVTINDSYTAPDKWQEGQTLSKKVSITNPSESNVPVYVRLQFKEYLERYTMEKVTGTGGATLLFATYADGANKGEFMTWADAQAGGYNYDKYTVTYADGTTADFALTKNAELRDGIYGKEMYIQSALDVFGTTADPDPVKAAYPDQDHDVYDPANPECNYPVHIWNNDDIVSDNGIDKITDYISWALGTQVVTMNTWKAAGMPTGDFWVLDTTDGWTYWANPIQPGESTANIMNSITLNKMPGSSFEYYIHIDQQAVSFDDLDMFADTSASGGGGVTADGQSLIDALQKQPVPGWNDNGDGTSSKWTVDNGNLVSGDDIVILDQDENGYKATNVPGVYEVLDENFNSQTPKQYIYDPDDSLPNSNQTDGDELPCDENGITGMVVNYASMARNNATGQYWDPVDKAVINSAFVYQDNTIKHIFDVTVNGAPSVTDAASWSISPAGPTLQPTNADNTINASGNISNTKYVMLDTTGVTSGTYTITAATVDNPTITKTFTVTVDETGIPSIIDSSTVTIGNMAAGSGVIIPEDNNAKWVPIATTNISGTDYYLIVRDLPLSGGIAYGPNTTYTDPGNNVKNQISTWYSNIAGGKLKNSAMANNAELRLGSTAAYNGDGFSAPSVTGTPTAFALSACEAKAFCSYTYYSTIQTYPTMTDMITSNTTAYANWSALSDRTACWLRSPGIGANASEVATSGSVTHDSPSANHLVRPALWVTADFFD
jgi:hypothetical protein